MTATINLLPPEVGQHRRARRLAGLTTGLVAVYVGALGGLYTLKAADVADAVLQRDTEQTTVSRLDGEVARLRPYGELETRHDNRTELLATAMATHISWSTVLSDLALAFPAKSSLLTLTTTPAAEDGAAAAPAAGGAAGSIDFGKAIADVQFTGYTVERFAPGTSGVLRDIDNVPGFSNPFLGTAGLEDRAGTQVTNFTGSVQLDEDAYSHRYDQGLPPEVTS